MKNKMTFAAMVVALLMVCAILTGCTNDTSDSGNSGNSSSGTETATNPFLGAWVSQQEIEGNYFKYVFDDSTVTTYRSENNKTTWISGVSAGYSWSGTSFQITNGFSGYISGGTLYVETGDLAGTIPFSK